MPFNAYSELYVNFSVILLFMLLMKLLIYTGYDIVFVFQSANEFTVYRYICIGCLVYDCANDNEMF